MGLGMGGARCVWDDKWVGPEVSVDRHGWG